MKRFVYIITDANRNVLNVGLSADLLKTVEFYNSIPYVDHSRGNLAKRLVYFEELITEQAAQHRFNLLNNFTRLQKEKLVRGVNPDWLDFSPALKLDLEQDFIVRSKPHNYRTQRAA